MEVSSISQRKNCHIGCLQSHQFAARTETFVCTSRAVLVVGLGRFGGGNFCW